MAHYSRFLKYPATEEDTQDAKNKCRSVREITSASMGRIKGLKWDRLGWSVGWGDEIIKKKITLKL